MYLPPVFIVNQKLSPEFKEKTKKICRDYSSSVSRLEKGSKSIPDGLFKAEDSEMFNWLFSGDSERVSKLLTIDNPFASAMVKALFDQSSMSHHRMALNEALSSLKQDDGVSFDDLTTFVSFPNEHSTKFCAELIPKDQIHCFFSSFDLKAITLNSALFNDKQYFFDIFSKISKGKAFTKFCEIRKDSKVNLPLVSLPFWFNKSNFSKDELIVALFEQVIQFKYAISQGKKEETLFLFDKDACNSHFEGFKAVEKYILSNFKSSKEVLSTLNKDEIEKNVESDSNFDCFVERKKFLFSSSNYHAFRASDKKYDSLSFGTQYTKVIENLSKELLKRFIKTICSISLDKTSTIEHFALIEIFRMLRVQMEEKIAEDLMLEETEKKPKKNKRKEISSLVVQESNSKKPRKKAKNKKETENKAVVKQMTRPVGRVVINSKVKEKFMLKETSGAVVKATMEYIWTKVNEDITKRAPKISIESTSNLNILQARVTRETCSQTAQRPVNQFQKVNSECFIPKRMRGGSFNTNKSVFIFDNTINFNMNSTIFPATKRENSCYTKKIVTSTFPPSYQNIIHNQILAYVASTDSTLRKIKKIRQTCISAIKAEVNSLFGGKVCIVEYGSQKTSLSIESSDFDLGVVSSIDSECLIPALAEQMSSLPGVSEVVPIKTAKHPLVKLNLRLDQAKNIKDLQPNFGWDELLNLKVDLTVCGKESKSEAAVEWVLGEIKKRPEIRFLMLFLKRLLHQHNLNLSYEGGLGSYSLAVLVTAFCRFKSREEGNNLGSLLHSFFEFYGKTFNFNSAIVDLTQPMPFVACYEKLPEVPFIKDEVTKGNVAKSSFNIAKVSALFSFINDKMNASKIDFEKGNAISEDFLVQLLK